MGHLKQIITAFVLFGAVMGLVSNSMGADSLPATDAAEVAGTVDDKKVPASAEEKAQIAAAVQDIKAAVPAIPEAIELYNNGPLVNSPGTGVGGADESVLQNTSLSMNTLGFGHQASAGNRIADDFTVTAGKWIIKQITFYAYQTNALPPPSTITAVNLQIWDGPPNDPASKVVWGDTTTNRMVSSNWSGIFRVTEATTGASTARYIMASTVEVNTALQRGTYWLDWQTDGSAPSGPWAPPITITGESTTGNALQSITSGVWNDLLDSGTATQQGLPFIIYGNPFSWIQMNPPITSGGTR